MVTCDTNVAVYAFSDVEPKAAIAFEVLAKSSFASVQLLNEFANVLVRKRRLPWVQVASMLSQLHEAVGRVIPLDEEVHREGVRIAERYRLSIFDALMLAAALTGGATVIYSEDMQRDLLVDGSLRIVDPFR